MSVLINTPFLTVYIYRLLLCTYYIVTCHIAIVERLSFGGRVRYGTFKYFPYNYTETMRSTLTCLNGQKMPEGTPSCSGLEL